ncbi:NUDIX hydrolase [Aestuariivivens marinum]|uniref:NUDIX hydrolase n=1 Tax=Aestuariivivens marinum TaxID=2913555 RepID=UPI001F57FF71|nr:NUDIX domain-containing protein [Aestuariivivens marinum]
MDELVDILDREGKATGKTCMKSEAHAKGYWHACINVWLYTKQGEVVIQKRAATKKEFPNTWDVSVAGHIGAGEDVLIAAQREVGEEVGFHLTSSDLTFIGNYATDFRHHKDYIDREYHYMYLAELTVPIEKLQIQVEEVAGIQLILISELVKKLESKTDSFSFVPYGIDYFKHVFAVINKKIQQC